MDTEHEQVMQNEPVDCAIDPRSQATTGRRRWAWEEPGAPRPDDRIIAMMTDLELVSHVQKATAEIRRRAKRNPALYELAGLLLNLPKQEPAKGFFAEIGEKLQNGS
jgi:hypothetical protein